MLKRTMTHFDQFKFYTKTLLPNGVYKTVFVKNCSLCVCYWRSLFLGATWNTARFCQFRHHISGHYKPKITK